MSEKSPRWMVSLHGGHSRESCDHASSTLEEIVAAAIDAGYHTFGITEHAPRVEPHRLYREERAMGWTVETLDRLFVEYAARVDRLRGQYGGRITLLKGFEAEVVPEATYPAVMRDYRERLGFDYIVGSVHWVRGHIIDYLAEYAESAVAACGGLENMAVCYFETIAEMTRKLRPEVIGHFDLVRLRFPDDASGDTPAIRRAALGALETIRDSGAILDVNTGGYRKGIGRPLLAGWQAEAAHDMGIPVCFGDDSHSADHVGADIARSRAWLLRHGIREIATLHGPDRVIPL
jgi:histidinol-phosphatase (PHP family)